MKRVILTTQCVLLFLFINFNISAQNIEGFVWTDINFNGIQDGGLEVGIAGVDVDLFLDANNDGFADTPGVPLSTVVTDPAGMYSFDAVLTPLVVGNGYMLTFTQPIGWTNTMASPQDIGSDLTDSDIDQVLLSIPSNMYTGVTLDFDAGFLSPQSVMGTAFIDKNGDGINESINMTESVTVELIDCLSGAVLNDINGLPLSQATVGGTYNFMNIVPPREYCVRFTLMAGSNFVPTTFDNSNIDVSTTDSDIDRTTFTTNAFTILPDAFAPYQADAGYYDPIEIGDFVWEDLDGDGVQDPGEVGLGGVTVEIYTSAGVLATGADGNPLTTVTDGAGMYSFNVAGNDNVPPGDFYVQFSGLNTPNWYITKQNYTMSASTITILDDSDPEADPTSPSYGQTEVFTICGDGTTLDNFDIDAGYWQPVDICMDVFIDCDGDGIYVEGTDQIINGFIPTITLEYFDAMLGSWVSALDADNLPATLASNVGCDFLFSPLPPGMYRITANSSADFCFTIPDYNGGTTQISDDVDDSDFAYVGSPCSNMVTSHEVSLESNDDFEDIDLGYIKTQDIEVYTWEDDNGDGLQNTPDEDACGLAGVTVELFDFNTLAAAVDIEGNIIPAGVTTGGDPGHTFMDVPPGQYYINFIAPADYHLTIPDVSGGATDATDVADDSDALPIVGSTVGDSHDFAVDACMITPPNKMIDAGFYKLADIGDLVFNDKLGDGCFDGMDEGFDGIQLTLEKEDPIGSGAFGAALDVLGNAYPPQLTDAAGMYLFEDVPPGNYRIQSTDPTGMRFLTDPDICGGNTDATDGTSDSDAVDTGDMITGNTHTIELRSKTNLDKLDIDIGYFCVQVLSNQTWGDANNDGIFDVGTELGFGMVTMELWKGGVLVQTVMTMNDGTYEFIDVEPGDDYEIIIPAINWNIGGPLVTYRSSTAVFPLEPPIDNDNNGDGPQGGPITTGIFEVMSCMEPIDDDDTDNKTDTTIDFGFWQEPCDPNAVSPIPEHTLYDQCNDGTEEDAESNPICDLQLLDTYCAVMPTPETNSGFSPLCTGGNTGGASHNTGWFSFIAGSPHIILEFIPTNCTASNGGGIGFQVGIYDGCPADGAGNSIWCQGIPCVNGPQILDNLDTGNPAASGQMYVPGQQYYLFIDGCNASVCEVEVNVIQGAQPFDIPPIQDQCDDCTEVIAFEEYDICTGALNIPIQMTYQDPTVMELAIDYLWAVNPPFGPYIDTDGDGWGEHPNNGTDNAGTIQEWTWDVPGTYMVRTIATNGCDTEETIITINVETLADEIFDDFYFCENDILDGLISSSDYRPDVDGCYSDANDPWSQDPNGDGILGWQGPDFLGTFFQNPDFSFSNDGVTFTYEATTSIGCIYNQEITLFLIDSVVSQPIDTAFCDGSPLFIQGTTVSQPFIGLDLFPIPSLVTKCDSTTILNVKKIMLPGSVDVGPCEDGEIKLTFEYDPTGLDFTPFNANPNPLGPDIEVLPENYITEYLDSVIYVWTDDSGGILDDNVIDSDSTCQKVDSTGLYTLTASAWANGVSCDYVFGPFNIDFSAFTPAPPDVEGTWDLEICDVGDKIAVYTVVNDPLVMDYQWTVPGDATITMGQGSNSITVDWTGSLGGEVCAGVEGPCGVSEVCQTVVILPNPTAVIDPITGICVDGTASIQFGGMADPGLSYVWDFDGGTITNSAMANSPGPFDVEWPTSGIKTITLTVTLNGCVSTEVMETVELSDPIGQPMPVCSSDESSVTITWPDVTGNEGYEITVNGGTPFVVTSSPYTEGGLMPGDAVMFTVTTVSTGVCGNSEPFMITCTAQDCVEPTITLTAPVNDICLDGMETAFDIIVANDDPDMTGDTGVFTGTGITDAMTGTFDPATAGAGNWPITYTYTQPGCITVANVTINVFDIPDSDFTVSEDTICITNSVTVQYTGSSTPENFIWTFDSPSSEMGSGGTRTLTWDTPGLKTITLITEKDGCQSTMTTLTVLVDPELELPDVQCIDQTSSSITFGWDAIPGVTEYEILIDGSPEPNQTATTFMIDNLNPGDIRTITVTAVSTNACPSTIDVRECVATDCPNAIINIDPDDSTICISTTTLIDFNATIDIDTTMGDVRWRIDNMGMIDSLTGTFDHVSSGLGLYTVTFEYTEGNCFYDETTTVRVTEKPVASFDLPMGICIDSEATLTYAGDTGNGFVYTWDFDGATVVSGMNEGPYQLSFDTARDYNVTVSVTTADGCQSDAFGSTITVESELPAPAITCMEDLDQIVFSWTGDPCYDMYEVWIDGMMVTPMQAATTYTALGLTVGQMVTIRVVPISTTCLCPVMESTETCTAQNCPDITIDLTGNTELSFCEQNVPGGFSLTEVVAGNDNTGSGVWSGSGISADGTIDPTIAGIGINTYTYTYTQNGCTYMESIDFEIFDHPSSTVVVSDPPCPEDNSGGGEAIFDPQGGNGPYTIFVDGGLIVGLTAPNLSGGAHSAEIVDANGCNFMVDFSIALSPEFAVAVNSDQTQFIKGDSIDIELMTNIDQMVWDSVVWTVNGVFTDCTSLDCIILSLEALEDIEVCATLFYNGECVIDDCIFISVNQIIDIYVPNIFNPNSEVGNSTFMPFSADGNIRSIPRMSIYDRWGELVWSKDNILPIVPDDPFSGFDPDEFWNGTFKGEKLDPGVYVYYMLVDVGEATPRPLAGDITLIR